MARESGGPPPFPHALGVLADFVHRGVPVDIISHKTRRPFLGPAVDLHAAAMGWLEAQGCFDQTRIGLPRDRVHFCERQEEKLAQIASCGCSHFVDDLPEILLADGFPRSTLAILFAPAGPPARESARALTRLSSWAGLPALLESRRQGVS